MRNSAAFVLPVNGKCASERIDVFFVAGCEGPHFGISVMKPGIIAQNFRRIVVRIQRDAEQTCRRQRAAAAFDYRL